ncbi:MAG: undecaprenyldiphospho-muramoylpentapeptide beta-N-acetylglucosaminyltransferase [Candidatus Omnitrophica bacterium]|nr:undecaprenyldiphospho-muramoylpentapeptide beta-N-acetylglucosaminyltransferase [Candidatus Omnitrophota bacterium]
MTDKDRMSRGAKILIAAGGSGGHIFPAVALARNILKSGKNDILFIGSKRGLDKKIFEKEGFKYRLLSGNKLSYKNKLKLPFFFLKLLFDLSSMLSIIISYKPDAVVGFGGYVSFPAVIWGRLLGARCVLHEQNVSPGRANKLLFRFADSIGLSFRETETHLGRDSKKAVFTGNPIRDEMFKDDHPGGIKKFGLDIQKFTILVVGGSQGAHRLNQLFVDSIALLEKTFREKIQIIHLTGIKDYNWVVEAYRKSDVNHSVHTFIDRIEEAYSASDMIVTRSGASAIFEAALFARPMVLVPYPFALNHQMENAKVFAKKGAAIILEESAADAGAFRDAITELVGDSAKRGALSSSARAMAVPDASDKLAKVVLDF